jgi:predicted kinase
MKTDEQLIEEYIKTIKTAHNNTKKLFAIGFIGINGVGKSFVAKKLAEKIDLFIGSNDDIRRFLNNEGFKGASPNQELLQRIAEASGDWVYKNNISHIIDADLIKFQEKARAIAKQNGAKLFLVHLTCSEKIILERLQKRQQEISVNPQNNLSRVGVEEYLKRKGIHETTTIQDVFFKIDTGLKIDPQIEELINKLKQEKVL